jgi:hypothetical protein
MGLKTGLRQLHVDGGCDYAANNHSRMDGQNEIEVLIPIRHALFEDRRPPQAPPVLAIGRAPRRLPE